MKVIVNTSWLLYCIVIIVRARNKRQVEKYFFILFFVLLVLILVEVNKLVFFKKKYDACAVGAPYFSKSFGATFQSYFRDDKKLT